MKMMLGINRPRLQTIQGSSSIAAKAMVVTTVLLILPILFAASAKAADDLNIVAVEPPKDKVPAGLVLVNQGEHALVVDKKTRTVTVWNNRDGEIKLVTYFPADIGKNHGDKKSNGDYRTPEGIYFLQETQNGRELDYNLFGERVYKTDYPNFFDRSEGKTGSGIWLHAVPDTVPLTRGSRGCVVVRNQTIVSLGQYIKLHHTPIIIHDEVEYVTDDVRVARNKQTLDWLESWRSSWVGKNIDKYIQNYSPEFKALGMDVSAWRSYKAGLNDKYKFIDVKVRQPVVYRHGSRMIIRFVQEYQSDQHTDLGEKTLYLREENGQYRILGEDWRLASQELVRQMAAKSQ